MENLIEILRDKNNLIRFTKFIQLDILTGCWNWTGSINKDGYGNFSIKHKNIRAHRFSYVYWNGCIQTTLVLNHICRNRKCVNPEHLEQVTVKENINKGRRFNSEKTHCIHGHEFTEENTYILNEKRDCKICRKLRMVKFNS